MSEWWTYRLSSFLLFSPRTYLRLHERYNVDVWPAQLVALVIGVALLVILVRRPPNAARIVAFALAACWAFVAWAWHVMHYAAINWAATYFAAAFALQALLLLWVGVVRGALALGSASPAASTVGNGLVAWGLIGLPILNALFGQGIAQADFFGTGADSTVAATLGVLLLARGRRWPLWPIPLAWCAITGAFAAMMRLQTAPVMPLVALVAVLPAVFESCRRHRGA
jgi:hypothetical protein